MKTLDQLTTIAEVPINCTAAIPRAACPLCGGWTGFGGCSQHRDSAVHVSGRSGCTCGTINRINAQIERGEIAG